MTNIILSQIISIIISYIISIISTLISYNKIGEEGFKCNIQGYNTYKNNQIDNYILNTSALKKIFDILLYLVPIVNIIYSITKGIKKVNNIVLVLELNNLLTTMSYNELCSYNSLKGFFKKLEFNTSISYNYVQEIYGEDNIVEYYDLFDEPKQINTNIKGKELTRYKKLGK